MVDVHDERLELDEAPVLRLGTPERAVRRPQLASGVAELDVEAAQVAQAALLPSAQQQQVGRLVDRREVGRRQAASLELLGGRDDRRPDQQQPGRLLRGHDLEAEGQVERAQAQHDQGVLQTAQARHIAQTQRAHDLGLVEEQPTREVRCEPPQRRTDVGDGPGVVDEDPERCEPVEVGGGEADRHVSR